MKENKDIKMGERGKRERRKQDTNRQRAVSQNPQSEVHKNRNEIQREKRRKVPEIEQGNRGSWERNDQSKVWGKNDENGATVSCGKTEFET